jgi:hypothetical protein
MMQSTENNKGPKVNRVAAPLKTLEAFANLKESEEEWRSFFQKHLEFFADRESCPRDAREGWPRSEEESSKRLPSEFEMYVWYQHLLRSVWASNDPEGRSLSYLFRVEVAANSEKTGFEDFVFYFVTPPKPALPKGKPVVDGITGKIQWEFSTEFQQSLYELMQVRWRAKVCRECGKYFIAKKTAQTLCSEKCARTAQLKRSREYWDKEGKAKRETKSKEGRND